MNDGIRPHYPWQEGDQLFAAELNAAIANAGSIGGQGAAVNVIAFGADPTGVLDSSSAINQAASIVGPNGRHGAIYLPTGTYRVNHQINLTASQGMIGDARGSSILYVDDKFDPAATAVIFITSSAYDAGPTLRDFGITFQQPWDQGSRANFRTLAAGGTSGPGGTGVKYPWAIASGTDSFRIQIIRVRIGGAWDGITSNNHNTPFLIEDVEMGALDCGLSLGEGPLGIQDFSHISAYHFWTFEMGNTALLTGVFYDGEAIAMRVGRCDGLNIRDFSSFCGRLVVTPDAAGATSIHITNCMMDSGTATVEINGAMLQFHISNMYSVSGVERPRAGVGINATCNMNISNFYSHNSANFPDFLLTSPDAKLTLTNFRSVFYPNATRWAEVRLGFLRITNGYLSLAGPRTVAAIAETAGGILSVDNVLVQGSTASGPLISVVTDTSLSMIGRVSVEAGSAWTYSLPAGLSQDFYSPVTLFHGGRVFADGFFAGGVLQVGDPAGMSATVALMGAAGTTRQLVVSRGANPAWSVVIGVGDNFLINRYDDAGAPVDTPLDINRATGLITALRLQAVTFGMNTGPVARQTVTGSRGGNAALASFLTAMAAFGFITDSTTA